MFSTFQRRLEKKTTRRLNDVFENGQLLTFKECCLHPLILLYISKYFLEVQMADEFGSFKGNPIIASLLAYSFSFSCITATVFLPLLSLYAGTLYETILWFSSIVVGILLGYLFTIQQERIEVNYKLDKVQATVRLRRWRKNGTLSALLEAEGLEYPNHVTSEN